MNSRGFLIAGCAVILAVVALSYVPVLRAGFTNYDDDFYVAENPLLLAPLAEALPAFILSVRGANWHPLTWLSHWTDVRLFGLSPRAHHFHNQALHLANTVLVMVLLQMLALDPVAVLLGGILFGLHPLQVESVAWVAQRKTLLCMLFSLISLIAHVRRRGAARFWPWYGMEVAALALALMAKPMAVSVPVVAILLDLAERRGISGRRMVESIVPLGLAVASSAVTLFVQSGAIRTGAAVPFSDTPFVAAHGVLFYLGKIAWPAGLSSLYPYPDHARGHLPPAYLLAPLGLAILASATWIATRGQRKVRLGLAIFLVTLLPMIQLVPVGAAHAADRYVYLPMLGIALALGWLAEPVRRGLSSRGRAIASVGGLLMLIVLLGGLTWRRTHVWHDSLTLWSDVTGKHSGSAIAWFYRGNARLDGGDPSGALVDYARALATATPGLDTSRIHHNHGAALAALGRHREAVTSFTRAIERRDGIDSRLARGTVLQFLGASAEAVADFEAVLSRQPGNPGAHLGRGTALLDLGRPVEAVVDLEEAVAADPHDVVAAQALARARSLAPPHR